MIAFRVPVGRHELAEAAFFAYPLHRSSARPSDGPCRPGCSGCEQRRWDRDPGDEDDLLRRLPAISGAPLDRLAS